MLRARRASRGTRSTSCGCRARSSCRSAAAAAAGTGRYACLVALGAVIRGDTPHFDYVAGEAARGLNAVAVRARAAGRLRRAHRGHACSRRSTAPAASAGNKGHEAAAAALAGGRRHRPAPGASMLRPETKSRARALQLLYAWEMQGAPPVPGVASGLVAAHRPRAAASSIGPRSWRSGVIADVGRARRRGRAGERELAARAASPWSSATSSGSASSSSGAARCRPRWRSTRRSGWRTGSAARGRPASSTACSTGSRATLGAAVNILAGQLAGPRESAGGRRGDPPVRDLRPARGARATGCGWSAPAGPARRRGRRSTASRSSASAARNSFALLGRGAVRRAHRGGAGPTWSSRTSTSCRSSSPGMTDRPFCAIVPHLFGDDRVRGGAVADGRHGLGGRAAAAAGLPRARGSMPSARARATTWSRAACPPARIRVIHPGVDSARFTPDAGRPRAAAPRPSCMLDG